MAGPYLMKPRKVGSGYAMCTDATIFGGGVTTVYYSRSYLNYILCTASPGSGAKYRVAKTPRLRNSITSETIYGSTCTMTYPHNSSDADSLYGVYRTTTIGVASENEGVVPPYISQEIIMADTGVLTGVVIESNDASDNGDVTTGDPVTLLEKNPRIWSRFFNQSF